MHTAFTSDLACNISHVIKKHNNHSRHIYVLTDMGKHPVLCLIHAVLYALILSSLTTCGNDPAGSDSRNPASISLSTTLLYLKLGESAVVTVEVLDRNNDPITDAVLTWSSSNVDVAGVSGAGVITAHTFGKAEITVRSGSSMAVTHVFVSDEIDALVAFYTALNGRLWHNNSNWVSTEPLSHWHGLTINPSGRVEQISLEGNRLIGELPAELGDLEDLVTLNLTNNGLRGELPPELGRLAVLRELNLSNNNLNGEIPPELGRLTELRTLLMNGNSISGEIPDSFGGLRNLGVFYMFGNLLSGEIPVSMGNLSNLLYLDLSGNRLSGEIPSTLGNLSSLNLRSNELSGEIPASLGRLSRLTYLDLGQNGLSGSLPPELAGLSRLKQLYLDSNSLSGEIPPQFGNFAALERMFLSGNLLSGPVPPELRGLNNLWQLNLNNNRQLTGPLPLELTDLTNLTALWIAGTGLCAPTDPEFLDWLERIDRISGLMGVVHCQ